MCRMPFDTILWRRSRPAAPFPLGRRFKPGKSCFFFPGRVLWSPCLVHVLPFLLLGKGVQAGGRLIADSKIDGLCCCQLFHPADNVHCVLLRLMFALFFRFGGLKRPFLGFPGAAVCGQVGCFSFFVVFYVVMIVVDFWHLFWCESVEDFRTSDFYWVRFDVGLSSFL